MSEKTVLKFSRGREVVLFVLSLYVVIELAVEVIIKFPESLQTIFERIDLFICIVFIADYVIGIVTSEKKLKYAISNWFDLLSSIPFSSVFRLLRLIRIIKLVRLLRLFKLLRGIKAIKPITQFITKNKLRSILITYIIGLVFVLFYCSLGFYMYERETNEMVKTYFDAIWWGLVTVTTVGYGDIFPKTIEGRVFAIILTLCGIGLFSLITAELSSKFLHYINQEKKPNEKQGVEE